MEIRKSWKIIAVIALITAIYSALVYVPSLMPNTVNTEDLVIIESPTKVEDINIVSNPIKEMWGLEDNKTVLMSFTFDNRDLSYRWKDKEIFLRTTYVGQYTDNSQMELDSLLEEEYSWKNQLDEKGNIVLGGPLLLKDGRYQLHVHNGLSYSHKQYLFGDILHYFYANGNLENTEITVGGVKLKNVWLKDTHILEDNIAPEGGELIISTCLERNGDRRLLTGWKIVE